MHPAFAIASNLDRNVPSIIGAGLHNANLRDAKEFDSHLSILRNTIMPDGSIGNQK
jgi:hypothetical protein